MGKYSGLKGAMPRQIGHEPEDGAESNWNDEVVKWEREFAAEHTTVAALAIAYNAERNVKEALEQQAKKHGVKVEALERLLIRMLEQSGQTSIGLETGEKFRLDDKPMTKCVDPDKFNEWIVASGQGALLSVHANTRAAIATKRFVDGILETPGLELKLRTTVHRDKA